MNLKHLLMAHDKRTRIERFLILGIVLGAFLLGIGTLGSIFSSVGIPAVLTLVGSFITFVSTVILVFYWFARGDV
jgi:hypothetical protein